MTVAGVQLLYVWVFLVGPTNSQVVYPHENFDTRATCEKHVRAFQKAYNEQVECVRMVINHPDGGKRK